MGANAPDAMLLPWAYEIKLSTPKPETYHHPPEGGLHPLQGDKPEINLSYEYNDYKLLKMLSSS